MIKVDLARNYKDYADGKAVTVELPEMPRKGDKIITSDSVFDNLKDEDNNESLFIVSDVYLIEEYDNPFIEVEQCIAE